MKKYSLAISAWLRTAWPAIGALSAAFFGAFVLDPEIFDLASQEIVSLLSLVMAGVLPTAVLTATILRSAGLHISKILQYRDALLRQIQIWSGFFLISMTCCALVIIGKLTRWEFFIDIPYIYIQTPNLAPVISAGICVCIFFIFIRSNYIFIGIRSLVILSADIAVSEVQERERRQLKPESNQLEQMPERPGFGAGVGLRKQNRE